MHLGHRPDLLSPASLYELHSPSMTWASAEPLVPNWLYLRAHGYAYGRSYRRTLRNTSDRLSLSLSTLTPFVLKLVLVLGSGMNFWIGDYNGEKLVWHQGDVWGFRALLAFLPESDIGVVLLSNSDSADSIAPNQMWWRSIIEFYLFDLVQMNPNPTFQNATEMCEFPCNILPSLCPDSFGSTGSLAATGSRADADIDDVEIVGAEDTVFLSESRSASSSSASSSANGIPLNLADYLGVFRQEAYGNVTISWTNSTDSQLLMTMGNFVDMPPTATALEFQSNGGSDRFSWPIGDEEAQTLSNSFVDFLRDSVNGGVVSWMLFSAVDDDGLQMNIMFDKIADAAGNAFGKHAHGRRPPFASAATHTPVTAVPPRARVPEQNSASTLVDAVQLSAEQHLPSIRRSKEALVAALPAAAVDPSSASSAPHLPLLVALLCVLVSALLFAAVFNGFNHSKQIAALRVAVELQTAASNGMQQPLQRA